MNDLVLFTTKTFNGVHFDCYVGQEDSGDFWATRTQIGELLEYSEPGTAIKNIHLRNKDRLDRFSRVAQIELPSGGSQEVVLYNFKGLLEICRYSNQPKADAVMDWLWDVADEIRRTGSYSLHSTANHEAQLRAIDLERAKFIQSMADLPALHLSDESKAVLIHEAFKIITGHECIAMLPEVHEKFYSATELGELFGVSSKKIGRIAKANGLKSEEGGVSQFGKWILSKSQHSAHQCPTFVYNGNALDWFKEHSGLLL
ncbi:MAG: hypothetical protein IJS28_07195 [Synergistaceae bacterium]|nr:hypothetical protein [Synergistaceae bacterium]